MQLYLFAHCAILLLIIFCVGVGIVPDADYGYIEILLDDLLKKRGMSKNALAEKANLQRTQLNSYCNDRIKRPDLDVLSRICYVLDCDINDILKYTKSQEGGQEQVGNS